MDQLTLARDAGGSAHHIVAQRAVPTIDALEHDVLGAQSKQRLQQVVDLTVVEILPRIVPAGQDARLGEIRHEHVGAIDQIAHGLAQLVRVRRIHLAAVAHHRVHKTQGMRIFPIQPFDDRDLICRTQKTAVHPVEIDVFLSPRVQVVVQDIGRVMHGEHTVSGVR